MGLDVTRRFASFDDVELAYYDAGRGVPVVLLHGFAADTQLNWVEPGVAEAILDAGHRVVALDARGHGASDKPHDPAAYAGDAMARDVQCLLDHLEIDLADVCGYSMGGLTTLRVAPMEGRVRSAVIGGVGQGVLDRGISTRAPAIAEALEVDDPGRIEHPVARAFRAFADQTGADRAALAAIQRSRREESALPDPDAIHVPTLVVVGRGDELVGDPAPLAERLHATLVRVPGNHLTAVFAHEFRDAIVTFLATVGSAAAP